MADWKERLGGGAVASFAEISVLSGTSIQVAPSHGYRLRSDFYVTGATQVHIAYGVAATSTIHQPVASNAFPWQEADYLGTINAAVPSGASSAIRVRTISNA